MTIAHYLDQSNLGIGRMARDLNGKSVVITGASSGIGKATAYAFARAGCRLTLAARRGATLNEVAADCEALGGKAVSVVTDVVDAAAVQQLADHAVAAFGGIDVWVNNAGSGVIGRFVNARLELHQQTIAVGLVGTVNGAYVALSVFERSGRGTLINMASAGSWTPLPLGAAYTAAKFGVRGLSAALRSEYTGQSHIHICAIFPSLIDTPGLHHAANVTGGAINPGPYLYSAEHVAKAVVAVARRPRDEVPVGWMARAGKAAFGLARASTEELMGATIMAAISRADPAPMTDGTLLTPIVGPDRTDGEWRKRKHVPPAEIIDQSVLAVALIGGLVLFERWQRARRLKLYSRV